MKLSKCRKRASHKIFKLSKYAKIDYIGVGYFSFHDIILDHIVMFGTITERFAGLSRNELYFAMALGDK